jgi:hypothetical protein
MSGKPPAGAPETMPDIQVFLSRPAYTLGSAIVGTILVRPSPNMKDATQESLRSALKSVVVYVAGFCRIDARWHNVAEYTKIYGQAHPFLQLLYQDFDSDLLLPPAAEETVCFWATNGLELLELKERQSGVAFSSDDGTNGNTDSSSNPYTSPLLAFTFRVDIPMDLPHSISATTCRYHYSADVLIRTGSKERVIKTPFCVWTNPQEPPRIPRSQQQRNSSGNIVISGARVKFGTCQGMAHSNGWPCHLSPTEIHRPKGQMTVAFPRAREDVQTLRVSNSKGQPVCVMTVVGASKLTPGSRIHLQWDFPERISASKSWIPCHQVAACLAGEELAIYEDGKRTRTQSYVFDTCHEWVDPGVTHRVSKTLLLSMDAPCNLYTDIMELSIRCQIDITVKENGEYDNLRLELPCHVVHSLGDEASRLDEDEEQQLLPLSELLGKKVDPRDEFPTNNIASDLKILALQMEERLKKTKSTKSTN